MKRPLITLVFFLLALSTASSAFTISQGNIFDNSGQKWKGNGVFYLTNYADNSDNIQENLSIITGAFNACAIDPLTPRETIPNDKRICLWNYYDNELNKRKQLVSAEFDNIKNSGFNSITLTVGFIYNTQKIMPSRPGQPEIANRDSLPPYSCDGIKDALRLAKSKGLTATSLMFKPVTTFNEGQCDPMLYVGEINPSWKMFGAGSIGCLESLRLCDFAHSDVSDAFISYDISWEPTFFWVPEWHPTMLEVYDWHYKHWATGEYIEYSIGWDTRPAFPATLAAYNQIPYKGAYYAFLKKEWENWLITNYGSVDAATVAFGQFVGNPQGLLNLMDNPSQPPNQGIICAESPSVLASAERRFMNDVLNAKYKLAVSQIKSIDPVHAVSTRAASSIEPNCAYYMPYEQRALAKNLDMIPEELYQFGQFFLQNNGDFILPGSTSPNAALNSSEALLKAKAIMDFIYGFSSFNGKKPVYAPEVGWQLKINNGGNEDSHTKFLNLLYQAAAHSNFTSLTLWVYSDSSAHYLDVEGVDFPITFNETSGPRLRNKPRIAANSQTAQNFLTSNNNPTQTVTIDLDKYGDRQKVYSEKINEIYNILKANPSAVVGVKTDCTDRSSTDSFGLIKCVGNAANNYACPLKCFNAQFNNLEIMNSNNQWQKIKSGNQVTVKANSPIKARASVGNLTEGVWKTANVRLGSIEWKPDAISFRKSISSDVQALGDNDFGEFELPSISATKKAYFRMVIENVAWFGEEIQVTLTPAKTITNACPDAKKDGVINILDLVAMAKAINQNDLAYNLNADTSTDIEDLRLVADKIGINCQS
ncbi:MAG: hypothetical protein Q7R70_03920 [Candidatus Diapherotrites archaeon]|nr:hypothetical protein [Candidatus Diapherotrites archaeon]